MEAAFLQHTTPIPPAPLACVTGPKSIRTTLLLFPFPVSNVRPPPWQGTAGHFPDGRSSPWGDPESAPTLLCGARYSSLNFTYFHLKDPVLERAEIFLAFCLLLDTFWHVPARFTIEKQFVPLQTYFIGAT